jgi:hypothetical protein
VAVPGKARRGAADSVEKEIVECKLESVEIGAVVVTLERHPDETLLSALGDGTSIRCSS